MSLTEGGHEFNYNQIGQSLNRNDSQVSVIYIHQAHILRIIISINFHYFY